MISNNKNLAILVGINAYGNGIPSLKTPVNDVTGLAKVFQSSYQYDVKLLLDSEATLERLNTLLDNLKDGILTLSDNRVVRVESYNRVLFYFAGHGITEDAFENQDGPTGYLIPQDAKKDDKRTFLQMQPLHDVLVELKCRHLLVILDCCFAGAFRFLRNLISAQKLLYREQYDRFMKGKAQQMIASASYDEKALDVVTRFGQREGENTGKNSPFAEVLLKALQIEVEETHNGGAKAPADIIPDGVITASELYIYLEKELAGITDRQTPGLYPLKYHEKGEYIFQVPSFVPDRLEKAPPLNKKSNPYRGLESFNEEHKNLFFGRERVIDELYFRLHETRIKQPSLKIVTGASGTGKSSLVKAGLLPRLREDGWYIINPLRPGKSPFSALAGAIFLTIVAREASLVKASFFENINKASYGFNLAIQAFMKIANIFAKIVRKYNNQRIIYSLSIFLQQNPKLLTKLASSGNSDTSVKLLLVIDQFEELVTECHEEEKDKFLAFLEKVLRENCDNLRVIITLRSDFKAQFSDRLLDAKQWGIAQFTVPMMTQDEFREIIEKPATEKVLYFEPSGLVDELINEVVQMPGALPLLSFTLSQLYFRCCDRWQSGEKNRAMTLEDYQALGGVMGALKKTATDVFEKLVQEKQVTEQMIRHVMLRMVAVSGDELARRRVPRSELEYPEPQNGEVEEIINAFIDARLLVTGTSSDGEAYVEPAHDALVNGWDRILVWKNQQQDSLLLQRRLTPAAMEWKQKRQGRFLWNANPYLDVLRQVLKSNDRWFNQLETEFVKRSIRARQISRAKVFGGIFAFIAIVMTFAGVQYAQRVDAEIQSEIASSNALLASNSRFDALLEAIRAGIKQKKAIWSSANTKTQVVLALQQAIYAVREQNRLEKHTKPVNSVSISPDGETIASASDDGTIKLWSRKGRDIASFEAHRLGVQSIEFAPNGQLLVAANGDGTIAIWNLKGQKIRSFEIKEHSAAKVSFSPDGKLLVSAGGDGTVKLWNLEGKELKTFKHSSDGDFVFDVSFSPDGQVIASGSDESVKLWSLDGALLQTLEPSIITASDISFSPDGKLLAAVDEGSGVFIWRVEDGKQLDEIEHFDIDCAIFSPDGNTIALAGWDETIELWDIRYKEITQTFVGHSSAIFDMSFSPDGKTLVSASNDSNLKIWSLDGIKPVILDKVRNSFPIKDISFSPNGKTIATAHPDKSIRFWNVDDGTLERIFSDLASSVRKIGISSNGQMLAYASGRNVHLLNDSGELLESFEMPAIKVHGREMPYFVKDFSLSPDDNKVAAVGSAPIGNDSIVVVWNIEDNEKLATFKVSSPVVSFSPDSKILAYSGSDRHVTLWREDTNKTESLASSSTLISSISFSQDSRAVAAGNGNGDIILWQLNSKQSKLFKGHIKSITSLSFHPDRNIPIIASGSRDSTVKVWSLDGSELQTIKTNSSTITDVSFSPDGKLLAGVDGNVVMLWNFDLNNLLAQGCDWLRGYLNYNPNLDKSDRFLCDDITLH